MGASARSAVQTAPAGYTGAAAEHAAAHDSDAHDGAWPRAGTAVAESYD